MKNSIKVLLFLFIAIVLLSACSLGTNTLKGQWVSKSKIASFDFKDGKSTDKMTATFVINGCTLEYTGMGFCDDGESFYIGTEDDRVIEFSYAYDDGKLDLEVIKSSVEGIVIGRDLILEKYVDKEEKVQWEYMTVANSPYVCEYEVGKCQRLCLDGLVIWKDAPGQKLYVCWSESDTNLADGFEKYDASSSLKIRHNVDFNKCGEYDVTVYEGDLSCSFKVNVVETKKDTPVKTEEEAVALAKRYVYAEYKKSFYQEDGGMFKYSVTVDKGPGTWVVFWSQDVEWDGMYVCGGGGPEVVIDAETGEVLSCGIMQ